MGCGRGATPGCSTSRPWSTAEIDRRGVAERSFWRTSAAWRGARGRWRSRRAPSPRAARRRSPAPAPSAAAFESDEGARWHFRCPDVSACEAWIQADDERALLARFAEFAPLPEDATAAQRGLVRVLRYEGKLEASRRRTSSAGARRPQKRAAPARRRRRGAPRRRSSPARRSSLPSCSRSLPRRSSSMRRPRRPRPIWRCKRTRRRRPVRSGFRRIRKMGPGCAQRGSRRRPRSSATSMRR